MINEIPQGQTNHCPSCEDMAKKLHELESECNEQARLNGMGSEREARQLARIAELEQDVQVARGQYQGACDVIKQLEQRDRVLVDAAKGVFPYVVTQVVACHGLKCREAVCESCSEGADEAAQEASNRYHNLQQAINATPSQTAEQVERWHIEWMKRTLKPVAHAIIDQFGRIDGGLVDGRIPPYPANGGIQNWEPLVAIPKLTESKT